jgi:hypothetical protein
MYGTVLVFYAIVKLIESGLTDIVDMLADSLSSGVAPRALGQGFGPGVL